MITQGHTGLILKGIINMDANEVTIWEIRDEMAVKFAMALAPGSESATGIAKDAYAIADAMLAEKKNKYQENK